MSVTVDDLPGAGLRIETQDYAEILQGIQNQLKSFDAPAIGFVNETKLYRDEKLQVERLALLRAWMKAGYELGNHTFSHHSLHRTELTDYLVDIKKGETLLRPLLAEFGQVPRYFRHPMLHTGQTMETKAKVHSFLKELGYQIAPVTIDSSEWIYARAYDRALLDREQDLASRIANDYVRYMLDKTAYFERQSEVLLGRNMAQTLLIHANRLNRDHLNRLLGDLKDRGYRFVTLEEALKDPAYQMEDRFTGRGGITWLHRWCIGEGKRDLILPNEPEASPFVMDASGLASE